MSRSAINSQISALRDALKAVKPVTPMTTLECMELALVKSKGRQMGKRPPSVSASSRRKNSAVTEKTPALPRPHCEMCGASECLRPWLDDRCHCNACLEIDGDECDSPRMKARRAAKPSCSAFFASKCYKSKFELARQTAQTSVLKQCSSTSKAKEQFLKDQEGAERILKKKDSTHSRKRTPSRKLSASGILSLPVPLSHKSKSASDPIESPCTIRNKELKRSPGVQSKVLEPRPDTTSTVTPFSAQMFPRKSSKQKDALAKQLGASSTKRSASSGATVSTTASSNFASATHHGTASRGRSRSCRTTAGFESPPALPRPHCEVCGASECLRPSLDDRCHCNACLRIDGQECDSPRMKRRRLAHPSCASFYASRCLKEKFLFPSKPTTSKIQALNTAELQGAKNPSPQAMTEEKSPSRELMRIPTRPKPEPEKKLRENKRGRPASAKEKVQLTLPLTSRAQSKPQIKSHARSRSSHKRDPSIESPPQRPRPHCEMCGASERLRPWLDDRCHCNACLEDNGDDCDSPRMKTRRASKPSCATFYASKCIKHVFEQKAAASTEFQNQATELEGTVHNKLSRKPTKKLCSLLPGAYKQNKSPPCPPKTLQASRKRASKSFEEKAMTTLASSAPCENLGKQVSAAAVAEKTSTFLKPRSTPKLPEASCGPKSRRKRDPSVETAPALPRPHCAQCGHNECLRPDLDDRCHCEACLEKGGEECDSPRMKARRRSRPSCDSFYASKNAKQFIEIKSTSKKSSIEDVQGQFGSPRQSPSGRFNNWKATNPSLAVVSKKETFNDEHQSRKQRKADSHSLSEAEEHFAEGKPWDEETCGGMPQSPSVFCIQRAWDSCRRRDRRGAVEDAGAQEQLAAALATAPRNGSSAV